MPPYVREVLRAQFIFVKLPAACTTGGLAHALAYARHLGPAGCAAALAPPATPEPVMTEAEVRRLAAAEGMQLVILDAVLVSGVKRARVL